jgi:glyoxylase-like metal-dependent hydrolase (beta-lactamase superfamily II)
MSSPLRADVYVAPQIPFQGAKGRTHMWSPISCTLIHGAKEAVLVDTPITIAQTNELADWIAATVPNKKLTTIYITHGHGDHFFGIPLLLKRFPGARAVATSATIAHMKQQLEPKSFNASWGAQFPDQIPQPQQMPDALPSSNEFHLEGHVCRAVEVGHSDTYDSTILWVPALKLAVCGDVVYGDVHQMLGEANTADKRRQWIECIEKVKALGPELVVPGHMRATEAVGVFHLDSTKRYIEDFGRILEGGAKDTKSLFKGMMEIYGRRVNEGALLIGCVSAFPKRGKGKL